MASLLLDFDSTLIASESLERILAARCSPQQLDTLNAICNAGMNGELSFSESLQQRLHAVSLHKDHVRRVGNQLAAEISATTLDAINILQQHFACWIVSGGLFETIEPSAHKLGIPIHRVVAVRLRWDDYGWFAAINPDDAASQNKSAAVRQIQHYLTQPITVVGDGVSDWQVVNDGLAQRWCAFTQYQHRPFIHSVVAQAGAQMDICASWTAVTSTLLGTLS